MKILVVDDNVDYRESMIQLLELDGHSACGAGTVQEALGVFQERPRPDLVILDLLLPDGNGAKVLDALDADPELHGTPVLVVTAFGPNRTWQLAKKRPGLIIATKPVSPEVILAVVKELGAKRMEVRSPEGV